jgi:cyanophycinase-like exopeptidase
MAAAATTLRISGDGWIVLAGGGEFSFGETEEIDQAWLAKVPPGSGSIGFVPAASGSTEYGGHFTSYLQETFERTVNTIPIYRRRDANRGKNSERIKSSAAVYLGAGVADHIIDAFEGTPARDALSELVTGGGTLVAMAAAAQALGEVMRNLRGTELVKGLALLPGGGLETNFDPGSDRRLRELLAHPEVHWGLGIPAGSAVLLGPAGECEVVGEAYRLDTEDGELQELS